MTVFAGDVDIDGIVDGDPEEPSDDETDPGALIGLNGARRKIELHAKPAEAFPVESCSDYHSWTVSLSVDSPGLVEFWDAPKDGNRVTDLTWQGYVGEGGQWQGEEIPSELHVQGVATGVVNVTLTCSVDDHLNLGGSTHTDNVLFLVKQVGLKSVTFLSPNGGGCYPVYADATGDAYGTPQWEDNSDDPANQGHLDGDAEDWDDDPADQQYPVCYESDKKLRVVVVFLAEPEEAFEGATIEGDGPDGLHFTAQLADFGAIGDKDYAYAGFDSDTVLTEGTVNWYHPLTIKWTLKEGGRSLSGSSANEVFVTLDAPECATLYRTVAYLACSNAGATTQPQALANTWAMFSQGTGEDEHPADVKAWNEDTRSYDRMLYYWTVDRGDDPEVVASNTGQLLQIANANGNCLAWVDIFHQALLVNNVAVLPVQVLPDVGVGGYKPKFIVKNVLWNDATPQYPGTPPWVDRRPRRGHQ